MSMLTEDDIRQVLTKVMDPELGRDIVSLGMLREVRIAEDAIRITLALTTLQCPIKEEIAEDVRAHVAALDGASEVQVTLTEMTAQERAKLSGGKRESQEGAAAHLNHIEHVLAVMSGKGGVGKSLVTGLLAVELRRRGLRVGILDADITGPSIPKMFGITERPQSTPIGIAPVQSRTGIRIMSINLLLPNEDDAVIWRGPLIAGAIKQFWGDVFWATLDYLLVDLPPGTADAPLTVMQSLPLHGVVLVTSPQDLAGMVVRKAAHMAGQLHVPILGVVENMSYAVCPHCGQRHEIFGASHVDEVTMPLGIPFLGQIPLDRRISEQSDLGQIEDYNLPDFGGLVDRLISRMPEKATTPRF
jgi:Mrp family chromosome partitioning ATPase